jgi:hypothetical protein
LEQNTLLQKLDLFLPSSEKYSKVYYKEPASSLTTTATKIRFCQGEVIGKFTIKIVEIPIETKNQDIKENKPIKSNQEHNPETPKL